MTNTQYSIHHCKCHNYWNQQGCSLHDYSDHYSARLLVELLVQQHHSVANGGWLSSSSILKTDEKLKLIIKKIINWRKNPKCLKTYM